MYCGLPGLYSLRTISSAPFGGLSSASLTAIRSLGCGLTRFRLEVYFFLSLIRRTCFSKYSARAPVHAPRRPLLPEGLLCLPIDDDVMVDPHQLSRVPVHVRRDPQVVAQLGSLLVHSPLDPIQTVPQFPGRQLPEAVLPFFLAQSGRQSFQQLLEPLPRIVQPQQQVPCAKVQIQHSGRRLHRAGLVLLLLVDLAFLLPAVPGGGPGPLDPKLRFLAHGPGGVSPHHPVAFLHRFSLHARKLRLLPSPKSRARARDYICMSPKLPLGEAVTK